MNQMRFSICVLLAFLLISCVSSAAADTDGMSIINGTIDCSNLPENASFIAAAYDASHALLGCRIYTKEGTNMYMEDFGDTMAQADSIKTFLWDKTTLAPIERSTNTLVVYFSATNTTETLAQKIHAKTGGDLMELMPAVPYTADDLKYYTDCRADREQNDSTARPAITGFMANPADYDTIFIGYPIWHGQAPKIIYTFLESYDFSGKTIVPFCTSASSGVGSSATNLHSICSGSNVTWKPGFRFSSSASDSDVENWLNGLNLTLQ